MTDVFSKQKRSEVMSKIRSSGNKDTELALMKIFRANRITGWRRHQVVRCKTSQDLKEKSPASFYVRPDFVFWKQRLAVFVDGCFWHGCPIHATHPKNNEEFWKEKLAANHRRDLKVTRMLKSNNWRVLRIWEHELTLQNQQHLIFRLRKYFPCNPDNSLVAPS